MRRDVNPQHSKASFINLSHKGNANNEKRKVTGNYQKHPLKEQANQ
jgi:hypothetical protein